MKPYRVVTMGEIPSFGLPPLRIDPSWIPPGTPAWKIPPDLVGPLTGPPAPVPSSGEAPSSSAWVPVAIVAGLAVVGGGAWWLLRKAKR